MTPARGGRSGQPGGNLTVSNLVRDVMGKLLGLLKEAVPRATRIAALRNPANLTNQFSRDGGTDRSCSGQMRSSSSDQGM